MSLGASAGGPAETVDICERCIVSEGTCKCFDGLTLLAVHGQTNLHDRADARNVDAAGHNVRTEQNAGLGSTELLSDLHPLGLGHAAVNLPRRIGVRLGEILENLVLHAGGTSSR